MGRRETRDATVKFIFSDDFSQVRKDMETEEERIGNFFRDFPGLPSGFIKKTSTLQMSCRSAAMIMLFSLMWPYNFSSFSLILMAFL